jgi:hypothetical protein
MNKLEESMGRLNHIEQDIEAMIYAIGDSARRFTEDELLNMLIGMNQLHKTRYEMMWQEYEVNKKKYNSQETDGDNFDYWNSVPLNNGRFITYC